MNSVRMRKSCVILIVALSVAVVQWANVADARTWMIRGTSGYYRYSAEIDRVSEDGQTVYMRNTQGKLVKVPLAGLSSADREYVTGWLKSRQPTPPAPTPPTPPTPVAPSVPTSPPNSSGSTARSGDGLVERPGASPSPTTGAELHTDTMRGRRVGLLIGVGDYTDLAKLKLAVPDIVALREKLITTGFAAGDLVCMTTDETRSELRPTRAMIERQLDPESSESFMGSLQEGDVVLIALSGHGVEIQGVPYFCPSDAKADEPETMVSIDNIYKLLEDSPAHYKVVLIDACRETINPSSARSVESAMRDNFARSVGDLSEDSGVMVMQSCATGQISWENAKLGHGVFMYHLMEGLSGRADEAGNRDGVIQLLELFNFAADSTKNYTRSLPGAELQTPVLRGEFTNFDFTQAAANRRLIHLVVRIDHPNGPSGVSLPIIITRRNAFRPTEEPEVLAQGRTDSQGEIEMQVPMDHVGPTDELIARIAYRGEIIDQRLEDLATRPSQMLIASATPRSVSGTTPPQMVPPGVVPPYGTQPGMVPVPVTPPPTPQPAPVQRTVIVRPKTPTIHFSELNIFEQGNLKALANAYLRKAEEYQKKQAAARGGGLFAQGAADAAARAMNTAETNLKRAVDKIESKYGKELTGL